MPEYIYIGIDENYELTSRDTLRTLTGLTELGSLLALSPKATGQR